MTMRRQWIYSLLLLLIAVFAGAQDFDLNKPVPMDPAVKQGKLPNGLSYYIRANKKPEARAELRLVVHAGSIQEDDDQKGLAHFLEHMAFNGTKHFEKQELINYLQSIGMNFGADLNAYTSFDETVYMLRIPTDKPEPLNKAFDILEDWAHLVSFDPEEIEKERPVVVEEWRIGRGAASRMRDKQWPILFRGSKYAERMPIGEKQVIETFSRDTLLRFYRDWYRPDLMAVIAVGDFDVASVEKAIQQHFSGLQNPSQSRKREIYPVPPHEETRFAIASDPESARSSIQVIYKSDIRSSDKIADARRAVVEGLMFGMLNQRLHERTIEPTPPYLMAFSGSQRFVGPVEALVLSAIVSEGAIETGFRAVIEEARRAELHGFTANELERQKADLLRQAEMQYENREKTESIQLADALIDMFLYNEPAPEIAWQFQFLKQELPRITIDEINALARKGFEGKNRVVLVNLPQKEGVQPPSEATLAALFDKTNNQDLKAYEETVSQEPLLKTLPQPGTILSEKTFPEIGLTEWVLNNGIRVLLKPTDFKNDEILFSAWSPGGSSLTPDADAVSAQSADDLVTAGGLATLTEIQLDKKLSGKIATAAPYIAHYYEGFSGRSAPNDFETALQLVYLRFISPRYDAGAIASFLARQKAFLENRTVQPDARFRDELSKLMTQNHLRSRPPSVELLKEINQERAFKIYQERFADAGDFTFAFVGSFDIPTIKPLILTYLGSLPALKRNENWKDLKILPPNGKVEKQYRFGKEPKSTVLQVFHGTFSWSTENRILMRVLCDYLNTRLREILREDMGGVYGVGVYSGDTRIPEQRYQIYIRFGCAPERVEELVAAVMAEIESLKTKGPDNADLASAIEALRRQHEVDLKDNSYWLSKIESAYKDQEDALAIVNFSERLQKATPAVIQQLARTYFNMENYVKAVLMPEATN